jgi:PPOX class probable F420-dependent enzyme
MAVLKAIPESHYEILDAQCYATVATLMPDGMISNNVVVLIRDGADIAFSTLKARQKYRNLVRDPRVGICVMHPDNAWKYLEIRGTVELEDDVVRSFIQAIARKYLGKDEYPYDEPGDERVTCRVKIDSVRAEYVHADEGSPEAIGIGVGTGSAGASE